MSILPSPLNLPREHLLLPPSPRELGRGAESKVIKGKYKEKEVAIKKGAPPHRYLRELWVMEKLREGREGERERERERDGEGEGEGMVVEVLGVVQLGELCSSSSSFSSSSSSSCFFSSSSSSFCSSSFSLPSSLLGKNLVMVVELMEEGCLYDFLDSGRRKITQQLALSLCLSLAKAVRYLHKQQLVHRDLSSLNVLVDQNLKIKISDFGRAFFLTETEEKKEEKKEIIEEDGDEEEEEEEEGEEEEEEEEESEDEEEEKEDEGEGRKTDPGGGSPIYQPPEVFYGKKFGRKGDVFSMSMIFWEIMTTSCNGQYETPYSEYPNLEFDFQILIQAAKYDLRPSLPPSLPSLWKRVIEGGWGRGVSGRWGSEEVVELLEGREIEK